MGGPTALCGAYSYGSEADYNHCSCGLPGAVTAVTLAGHYRWWGEAAASDLAPRKIESMHTECDAAFTSETAGYIFEFEAKS